MPCLRGAHRRSGAIGVAGINPAAASTRLLSETRGWEDDLAAIGPPRGVRLLTTEFGPVHLNVRPLGRFAATRGPQFSIHRATFQRIPGTTPVVDSSARDIFFFFPFCVQPWLAVDRRSPTKRRGGRHAGFSDTRIAPGRAPPRNGGTVLVGCDGLVALPPAGSSCTREGGRAALFGRHTVAGRSPGAEPFHQACATFARVLARHGSWFILPDRTKQPAEAAQAASQLASPRLDTPRKTACATGTGGTP